MNVWATTSSTYLSWELVRSGEYGAGVMLTTSSGVRSRSRLRSSRGIAWGLSCRCPAVRAATIGLPARSVTRWSLLSQPPRLRPNCGSPPPFLRPLRAGERGCCCHRSSSASRPGYRHGRRRPEGSAGCGPTTRPPATAGTGNRPSSTARPQHPDDPVENRAVILGRSARGRTLRWQEWRKQPPLVIGDFVSSLWAHLSTLPPLCNHTLVRGRQPLEINCLTAILGATS